MTSSCSWCHTMNDTSFEFCATCGHQAHESRMNCQCSQCAPGRYEEPTEEELREVYEREQADCDRDGRIW